MAGFGFSEVKRDPLIFRGSITGLLCIRCRHELAMFGVSVILAARVVHLGFSIDPYQSFRLCIGDVAGARG